MEVVETGFLVVVVATVAQGVACADGGCHTAGGGEELAPGAVLVGDDSCSCVIYDTDDIALQVVLVVVFFLRAAVLMDQTIGRTCFIVQEDQVLVSGALRLQLISQPVILGRNAAYGLAGTQPGGIVGIAVGIAALGCRCQLPPVAPCEGESIPVGQRVANGIVGNVGVIVGCQQILPVGVSVGVGFVATFPKGTSFLVPSVRFSN